MNLKTSFLNVNLEEKIYMKEHERFSDDDNNVCNFYKLPVNDI